jgi:hypothetical protein
MINPRKIIVTSTSFSDDDFPNKTPITARRTDSNTKKKFNRLLKTSSE